MLHSDQDQIRRNRSNFKRIIFVFVNKKAETNFKCNSLIVKMMLALCLLYYCRNRKHVLNILIGSYLNLVPVEIIWLLDWFPTLETALSVWQRTDALMRYFSWFQVYHSKRGAYLKLKVHPRPWLPDIELRRNVLHIVRQTVNIFWFK